MEPLPKKSLLSATDIRKEPNREAWNKAKEGCTKTIKTGSSFVKVITVKHQKSIYEEKESVVLAK